MPGIMFNCLYKGGNDDIQLLTMLITREVSVRDDRNATISMQGPLLGILTLHPALESHFYCTVTSAKRVH